MNENEQKFVPDAELRKTEAEKTYDKLERGKFAILSATWYGNSKFGHVGSHIKLRDTLHKFGYNVITPTDAGWDIAGFGKSTKGQWPRDVFTQIEDKIYIPYATNEVKRLIQELGIPEEEVKIKESQLGIGGNVIISGNHILVNATCEETEDLEDLKKLGFIISKVPMVTRDFYWKSKPRYYNGEINHEQLEAIEEVFAKTQTNEHIDSQINLVANGRKTALLVTDFYIKVFPEVIEQLKQQHNFDEVFVIDPIESRRNAANLIQLPDLKIILPGPNPKTKNFLQAFMNKEGMVQEYPDKDVNDPGGSLRCRLNIITRPEAKFSH